MHYEAAHHGGAVWGHRSCVGAIDADVLDAWFDPCPAVLSVLSERPGWVARTSPPTDGSIALKAICEARGLDPATVVLGAGSSDLIYRAMLRLVSPGGRALVLDPGYSEYPHLLGNVIGCEVCRLELAPPAFDLDLERLRIEAEGCRWVVLANPNNPAGRYVTKGDLIGFINGLPPETWVWLDEAYLEYVEGSESLEREVCGRNLVVLRSLSKTLALSGLRAAYLTARQAVAAEIRSITPPWVMSLPAQLAVEAAFSDPGYYRDRYRETGRLRAGLARGLASVGGCEASRPLSGPGVGAADTQGCASLTLGSQRTATFSGPELNADAARFDAEPGRLELVVEGAANWVLALLSESSPTAEAVCAACAERGLFIRDAGKTSMTLGDRAIRIAVKDESTNGRIVQILAEILG